MHAQSESLQLKLKELQSRRRQLQSTIDQIRDGIWSGDQERYSKVVAELKQVKKALNDYYVHAIHPQ